jgi:hypothetical protein
MNIEGTPNPLKLSSMQIPGEEKKTARHSGGAKKIEETALPHLRKNASAAPQAPFTPELFLNTTLPVAVVQALLIEHLNHLSSNLDQELFILQTSHLLPKELQSIYMPVQMQHSDGNTYLQSARNNKVFQFTAKNPASTLINKALPVYKVHPSVQNAILTAIAANNFVQPTQNQIIQALQNIASAAKAFELALSALSAEYNIQKSLTKKQNDTERSPQESTHKITARSKERTHKEQAVKTPSSKEIKKARHKLEKEIQEERTQKKLEQKAAQIVEAQKYEKRRKELLE